jgi:hypothetical protein
VTVCCSGAQHDPRRRRHRRCGGRPPPVSKRPSFQFYPADWSANPNLKRCTFAEKGIWLEVMCLLHDQAEYGVLRWSLTEIATAVKCRVADLRSLERKGVMKGADEALAEPSTSPDRDERTAPLSPWYRRKTVRSGSPAGWSRTNMSAASGPKAGPERRARSPHQRLHLTQHLSPPWVWPLVPVLLHLHLQKKKNSYHQ